MINHEEAPATAVPWKPPLQATGSMWVYHHENRRKSIVWKQSRNIINMQNPCLLESIFYIMGFISTTPYIISSHTWAQILHLQNKRLYKSWYQRSDKT